MHMDVRTGGHGDVETQRDEDTGAWRQGDEMARGHERRVGGGTSGRALLEGATPGLGCSGGWHPGWQSQWQWQCWWWQQVSHTLSDIMVATVRPISW